MTPEIRIPESMRDYLEGLHYDVENIRDLLFRAANMGVEGTPAHKFWLDSYCKKCQEYRVAKEQLEKTFVVPTLGESETVNWELDFKTSVIHVRGTQNA